MSASPVPLDDDQRRALDVARRLAAAGVPVFIARPLTTSTGGVDWGAGCAGYKLPPRWQDTIADPATVDAWQPGDALAAVMGHTLDALDVDPRSGGEESAGELIGADFWPTVIGTATTPSGGRHDFINPLGVGSRDRFRAGLDHKGGRPDGKGRGFVFIAPTVKPSKVTGELVAYRWVIEPMLDELDAGDDSGAALGELITAELRSIRVDQEPTYRTVYAELTADRKARADRYAEATILGVRQDLEKIAALPVGAVDSYQRGWEKGCADAANRLGRLARAPWSPLASTAAKALFLAMAPTDSEWTPGLVEKKWATQWSRRPALVAPWEPEESDPPGDNPTADNPPPPIPLTDGGPLPAFPTDALPRPVAAMVTAVATFTQTDPGMAGTSALSMLAACGGGRVEVQVRPGWHEPANLFTVTVAGPGERKSAVQATLGRPLLAAEEELAEAGTAERLEAATAKDVASKAAEHARASAGRAEGRERDRLLADAIGAAAAAEAITVPVVPRIVADDVTPEAAATLLAEQGGRLAVISAEGGIFDVIAGRYSNSVPNLDVWLKGHSGDALRVDRKGRAPEYVRRPALTLGLMVQPAVLTAIARHETFRGRGLLARFLYAVPPSRVGHRQVGMPPVPEPVAEAWNTLVRDLAVTLAGWHDPAVVVLDLAAAGLAIEMEAALEPQLGPGGTLEHIADWGSKLTGATLRIACLLHLGDDPQGSWRRPIGADTLRRAGRLADYYRAHALAAFDAMRADPTVADAEHLLEMIRRIGKPVVSTRDLFTIASRSRFPKVGDLGPPLAMLEDHGYISPAPQPERAEKRGRKPSPLWAVNPHVVPAQTTETAERRAHT